MANKADHFFWFETNKPDKDNRYSYYFHGPCEVLALTDPAQRESYFARIEQLSRSYYVAGFLSYELGYLLEDVFGNQKTSNFPYALFCAYKNAAIYDHRLGRFTEGSFMLPDANRAYTINNTRLNISRADYIRNVRKVKAYIRAGDIYQANYTLKYTFGFSGSPLALYNDLKRKQSVAYNVFAKFGDYHLVSLSPELFFRKNRSRIEVKPMKGTVKRGRHIAQDRENMAFLGRDEKNRAENVMIVDLLRNDLGRISKYNSVKVTRLFEVERFNTLFQMTSTVRSMLKPRLPYIDFFRSIFPSGSVTGAPKIRSMQIIRELEKEPRKVYTGAIGFFMPGGKAEFNVAIRTVLINGNRGEMGIGGGIVADSKPADEFQEARLKGHFLLKKPEPPFKLIETMTYANGYRRLSVHLKRLKDTAEYFGFRFNKSDIESRLAAVAGKLGRGKYKVRLLLDSAGTAGISSEPLGDLSGVYKLCISRQTTDSRNAFYFFKTTNRTLYNDELKKARAKGFFDVLFFNEKGQLTEGAITNVYLRKNGIFYTPHVECGLLNGTIRRGVTKRPDVREKSLRIADVKKAEDIYISNAVIGFRKALLSL
jgi:para-aminobenzoate synthetase/4-amino-4-deoxychorismate lyase